MFEIIDFVNLMRKSFLIVFLLSSSYLVKAQNFSAVLIAGMNASQVNGDSLIGFNKVGLVIGAGIENKFSEKAGLRLEFLYAQKGSSSIIDSTNLAVDPFKLRLNYVEVPLMFYYKATKKLNVEVGAALGLLLNAKFSNGLDFVDQTETFFRTDYNVGGGIGYIISDRLSANLRSTVSMINITKRASGTGYYNLVTSFTLRVRL